MHISSKMSIFLNFQRVNNYIFQQQYPLNVPLATINDYNSQSFDTPSFSQVDDSSHLEEVSHFQRSKLLYHHPKNSEEIVSM